MSDVAISQKVTLNISVVTTDKTNDLLKTLSNNYKGIRVYSSLDDALNDTQTNRTKGIMVLSDNYPDSITAITDAQAKKINETGVRLYIEYPSVNDTLGIIGFSGTGKMGFDRAVVMDSAAMAMEKHSLLYVHGAQFVKKDDISNSWLVNATVAGYDEAVYGLDGCVDYQDPDGDVKKNTHAPYSMLEVNKAGNVLIASTKLSQFISARYAPYKRWQRLWLSILSWVAQSTVTDIEWTPAVNSNYGPNEKLAADAYSKAVDLNAQWYINNMMASNGSTGIYQCFSSGQYFDAYGGQALNKGLRADCNGESVGAIALAGELLGRQEYKDLAYNTMKWMLRESNMACGDRADPNSAQYGLLSWYDDNGMDPKYLEHYYGDDNAKAILGLILAAAALGTDEFDKRILEAILANFRTTGIYGFRGAMLKGKDLDTNGWEHYFNGTTINYRSHFEALLWACYLWAYDKTGFTPLLERTKTAVSMMMTAYDATVDKSISDTAVMWQWTNGMQQERAKMIWPLAWLVRIEPTEQHIKWLDTMIGDMMKYQDAKTGALRDAVGEKHEGEGQFGPFAKNSDYGKHESPVIQENGDPCSDSLYTASFAMVALNEAYAAMASIGNSVLAEKYKQYAKTVSDYHVKIQQVSDNTKYNGVWFRGFDYEKWETYGSDGDAGWGIWCTETGWSQAQISSALSLQTMGTNIWDYTSTTTVDNCFNDVAAIMLKHHSD